MGKVNKVTSEVRGPSLREQWVKKWSGESKVGKKRNPTRGNYFIRNSEILIRRGEMGRGRRRREKMLETNIILIRI